ncbi:sugar phosphate isomerase/epimerase family protein [Weissella minor]|uniref:Xylose isomerase-like TIM barrel domain-containing protein n=1 Tax=Weissella minor TaxID=1620 RepID=A0A0R2JI61_9LACO|nr:TIM barrel protein [Weissella minor]KRN76977.1 hypothetical protein IV67_GL000490 [Weissella minor]
MRKEQIVLNNLVFNKEHAAGEKQITMLQNALDFGITSVEIRREYFYDIASEMNDIKKFAEENDIKLFYSVPEALFINNELNAELETYFDEAEQMGIYAIKFNIGEFNEITTDELATLNQFTTRLDQVNIENNQIKSMGSVAAIERFMKLMIDNHISIGYVYDMGNWRYVSDNELSAARALAGFVKYIHVKDAIGTGNQTKTVPLGEGHIHWRNILNILPKDVPVAIEYPVTSSEQITDGINKLQTGV